MKRNIVSSTEREKLRRSWIDNLFCFGIMLWFLVSLLFSIVIGLKNAERYGTINKIIVANYQIKNENLFWSGWLGKPTAKSTPREEKYYEMGKLTCQALNSPNPKERFQAFTEFNRPYYYEEIPVENSKIAKVISNKTDSRLLIQELRKVPKGPKKIPHGHWGWSFLLFLGAWFMACSVSLRAILGREYFWNRENIWGLIISNIFLIPMAIFDFFLSGCRFVGNFVITTWRKILRADLRFVGYVIARWFRVTRIRRRDRTVRELRAFQKQTDRSIKRLRAESRKLGYEARLSRDPEKREIIISRIKSMEEVIKDLEQRKVTDEDIRASSDGTKRVIEEAEAAQDAAELQKIAESLFTKNQTMNPF